MSSSSSSPEPRSGLASGAVVTPLVASLLDRCKAPSHTHTTLPAGAPALRRQAFLVRPVEERLALGDIVKLEQRGSTLNEYVLISTIAEAREPGTPAVVSGAVLVGQDRTPLAPIGPLNELFRTPRTWHGRASQEHICGLVEGARLRFAYDEQTCALVPLDNAAPPTESQLHKHDFVYIDALAPATNAGEVLVHTPWRIAQIKKLSASGAHRVRIFNRTAEIDGFEDEQLLTKGVKQVLSSSVSVRGKCWVESVQTLEDRDRLRGQPNVFYVVGEVKQCMRCREEREKRHKIERRLTKHRLKTLDLFAGAGGLSTGAVLSGVAKCQWANDCDPSAAATFSSLHSNVTVNTRDCNQLLRDIIDGRTPSGMPDPAQGLVDVMNAGPPCQGFSRANMSTNDKARPMDPRNMLVATTLAFVDVYRPRFVVLENVGGLVDLDNGKLGQLSQGFLKLILTCFCEMGYGVRAHIAQAAEYGVAQSRPRVIFLAARRDEPLPDFPQQTHAGFKKANAKQFKVEGCDARITACRCINGAPLPAVTAGAVLSDLPMFDWADPHLLYPDADDEHDRWRRERAKVIPSFDVPKRKESDRIGPDGPCAYRCKPRNSHQLALRQLSASPGISSQAYRQHVTQHQTTVISLDAAERVCNIKLAPNANYSTWPPSKPRLATWGYASLAAASARTSSAYANAFLRADPAGALQISMTRMEPGSKSGGNLHWDQYRLLSVREVARSQGFPDGVHFATEHFDDAIRQVGNAVPVPLARAVFLSILRARVERVEREIARAAEEPAASKRKREDE